MKGTRGQSGFTMIEVLIAMALLGIVATTMYQLMFSAVRSTDEAEDIVRTSEEARLGLNRMTRDTREGQVFDLSASDNTYSVQVDFDGDGSYANTPGNYEVLEFKYSWAQKAILLNGQVLVRGAEPIGSTAATEAESAVFSFTSNNLQYDANLDGITTDVELAGADLDPDDPTLYSNVEFAFQVRTGKQVTEFYGRAQLRNRR